MVPNFYRYIYKNAEGTVASRVTDDNYNLAGYGAELSQNLPLTSSVTFQYYDNNSDRTNLNSLKNITKFNKKLSSQYDFDIISDINTEVKLINIPNIFFGSSIKRGTVNLKFVVSGNVVAEVSDVKKNGELIQTYGSLGSGSVAGLVYYSEGFIVLTGSWNLNNSHSEAYEGSSQNPKWIHFGSYVASSSYDLDFQGTNHIPTLTKLCDAPKAELNHSNNPTYINKNYADKITKYITGSNYYVEDENIQIKNIASSSYTGYEENFEKQTFITKIAIYDKDKKLIGTAKLSQPIRKTEVRDYTFKLKLDF
jgi:hypothetical protein